MRRICVYGTLMFLVAGFASYLIHRYCVSPSLTPLQRVYFKQYLKATYRSYLPNSKSRYMTLAATIADPQTKRQSDIVVIDDHVDPVLDDQRRIQFDKNHRPVFQPKPGVPIKRIFWIDGIGNDTHAYEWFRNTIYSEQTLPDIWRPAWLGAILIFLFGTIFLTGLDMFAQRQYMKGQPVRGTRELLPKVYAREHRQHLGYSFTVYATT